MTLAANENTLYLSVAGTPTNFLPESIDEALQSYQSSPAKARFPYEMQITGATPYETPAGSTAGLVPGRQRRRLAGFLGDGGCNCLCRAKRPRARHRQGARPMRASRITPWWKAARR